MFVKFFESFLNLRDQIESKFADADSAKFLCTTPINLELSRRSNRLKNMICDAKFCSSMMIKLVFTDKFNERDLTAEEMQEIISPQIQTLIEFIFAKIQTFKPKQQEDYIKTANLLIGVNLGCDLEECEILTTKSTLKDAADVIGFDLAKPNVSISQPKIPPEEGWRQL
jgi:hypothetical protein